MVLQTGHTAPILSAFPCISSAFPCISSAFPCIWSAPLVMHPEKGCFSSLTFLTLSVLSVSHSLCLVYYATTMFTTICQYGVYLTVSLSHAVTVSLSHAVRVVCLYLTRSVCYCSERHLSLAPGAGCRRLVWNEEGSALFVSNELDGTVSMCSFDSESGSGCC